METDRNKATFRLNGRHILEILGIGVVTLLLLALLPYAGQGQQSSSSYYPPLEPPKPPTKLRTDPGVDSIELTWYPSPSTGLKGYWVYRGTNATQLDSFKLAYPKPIKGDRWSDPPRGYTNTLQPDTDYYYYLWAEDVNGQKSSEFSNVSNSKIKPGQQPPAGEPTPQPATKGELRIFMPDSGARPGETITVPVKVGNADGLVIESMDVWVRYEPDVIVATEVTKTTLLRDYAFMSNTGLADKGAASAVVLATGGKPTLYGEATLFEVAFQVTGTAGMTSPMALPLEFEIEGNPYGTTIYTDVTKPYIPLIHQDGVFTITVGANPPSYVMGDVEPAELGDGDVDKDDAQMALALAVGNGLPALPNHRQEQVGDLNGDERINSADAALIMRQASGLARIMSSSYGRFFAQNLMTASAKNPVTATVGVRTASPGKSVTVPIRLKNASQASGLDLALNYDPRVLEIEGISAADLAGSYDITYTQNSTQTVRISLGPKTGGYGLPSPGTGKLVNVNFKVKPDAPAGWSPFILTTARLSDNYGRDFASSDLNAPVVMRSGAVGVFPVYLPTVLKGAQ